MAETIIQCPHCRTELEIEQDPSGMELECPVCRKIFTVEPGTANGDDEKTLRQQENLQQPGGEIGNEVSNQGFQGPPVLKLAVPAEQENVGSKSKILYFAAFAAILLLCLLGVFFFFCNQKMKQIKSAEQAAGSRLEQIKEKEERLKSAAEDLSRARAECNVAATLLRERIRWPELINEVQAVLPNDVWLTKLELSRDLPSDTSRQNRNSDDDDLFGGMSSEKLAQQTQAYVSVSMTGYGLVRNENFVEIFRRRLVGSQYFEFGKSDRLPIKHWLTYRENEFNIADFQLVLKMKNPIKQ